MESARYLPDFMRDFHDQKDLFKTVHETVHANPGTQRINWVDAQIYTIDVFLWFMALRGYTLQRTRAKYEFLDIRKTVADHMAERRSKILAAMNSDRAAKAASHNTKGEKNV
jgi:hypothetical protein